MFIESSDQNPEILVAHATHEGRSNELFVLVPTKVHHILIVRHLSRALDLVIGRRQRVGFGRLLCGDVFMIGVLTCLRIIGSIDEVPEDHTGG